MSTETPTTAIPTAETSIAKRGPHILVRLWPLYLIAGGLMAAWQFGVFDLLSLETLKEQRETLNAFVAANPVLSVAIFIGIYALATTLMLPGALWITIAGGFLFGLLGGTLATIAGATLGASILFFAAKTSIGKSLRARAGPFLRKMEAGFRENEVSFMFAMRFMPVVPFPVANIAPALLGAKYRNYVITTALGIIPGVLAYTWIGAGAGAVFDAGGELNLASVAAKLVPAGIALGVVSLLPILYKRLFGNKAVPLEGSPS